MPKCKRCNSTNIEIVENTDVINHGNMTESNYYDTIECNDCGYILYCDHVCYLCAKTQENPNDVICKINCANRVGDYCMYSLFLYDCECKDQEGLCIPVDE